MSPSFLIIIVLLFGVLWFVLIRPQKRRQAEQRQRLESLTPGDEILTAGGVYGTVRSVGDDDVIVEIAPGTEVRVARRAVAAIIPPESEEGTEETIVHSGAESDSTPESRS